MRSPWARVRGGSRVDLGGGSWFSSKHTSSTTTRDRHCTLFHEGTWTRPLVHRTTPCAAHSSRGAKSRTQKVGAGDRHIHIHIYLHIYIYITLILCTKLGRRKGKGEPCLVTTQMMWLEPPVPLAPSPASWWTWLAHISLEYV